MVASLQGSFSGFAGQHPVKYFFVVDLGIALLLAISGWRFFAYGGEFVAAPLGVIGSSLLAWARPLMLRHSHHCLLSVFSAYSKFLVFVTLLPPAFCIDQAL